MAFGTFWGGEGVGVEWELRDLTIVLLMVLYGGAAAMLVAVLRSRFARQLEPTAEATAS